MERNHYIQIFDKFLRRQATTDEMKDLIQWLKDGQESNLWLNEVWDLSESCVDSSIQQKMLERINQKLKEEDSVLANQCSVSRFDIRKVAKWVAIFLLPLLSGVSVYLVMKSKPTSSGDLAIIVDKGQKASAVLPDGSKVWINSGSRLSYGAEYNEKERILKLSGEAYFDVKHDDSKPFIVHAGKLSVKALGTAFNVKSYDSDFEQTATLVRGKVEVVCGGQMATLSPNEQIVLNAQRGTVEKKSVPDAQSFVLWKNNEISFDGDSFASIAATLERRYNVTICFGSESLKKYRFTGTVGNTNLQNVLQILSFTSPLEYAIDGDRVVLKENKREKLLFEKAIK